MMRRWCPVCNRNVVASPGGDCPNGFCGGTYPARPEAEAPTNGAGPYRDDSSTETVEQLRARVDDLLAKQASDRERLGQLLDRALAAETNRYWSQVPRATEHVLVQVARERARQEWLRAQGRFSHTCASPELDHYRRLAILAEEFGEVARAVMESSGLVTDRHGADLRKELIQVAAVATAWVESFASAATAT